MNLIVKSYFRIPFNEFQEKNYFYESDYDVYLMIFEAPQNQNHNCNNLVLIFCFK